MTEQTIKIAISGAGVGGLALAAFISQNPDIIIDVYEAKPEVSAFGAGISIWKRSWQVLQDIGLDVEMEKRGIAPPKDGESRGPIFRRSDKFGEGFNFHNHVMPYGPVTLPRPMLLEMLQTKLAKNCTIHTSKRLLNFTSPSSGPIRLEFGDGTTEEADILVGADGIYSATRQALYRTLAAEAEGVQKVQLMRCVAPKWSGQVAYRCDISAEELKQIKADHQSLFGPNLWCGKNKHLVTYPIYDSVHIVCYATKEGGEGMPYERPIVEEVPESEILDLWEGWEEDVMSMLKLIKKSSKWAIFVVEDLPKSVHGTVALVGDAAHAMTPHQGVGGGQAIEDAYLLGRILAYPSLTRDNIPDALSIYEAIRLPQGQAAAQASWENGLMYHFLHPEYPVSDNSPREDYERLGTAVGRSFEWLADGGFDQDWVRAESALQALQSTGRNT